jgi:hypothetical protein
LDLLDRIAARFFCATLWYVPMDRSPADNTSLLVLGQRLMHPWPFLGLFLLVLVGIRARLHSATWIVIGIYLLYLAPYIVTSYYGRYAYPLLAGKVLLIVWALDSFVNLRTRMSEPAVVSQ